MKKALITGACGQDGSYLSEYLLSLGYEVHGFTRGITGGAWPEEHVVLGVTYHVGDMRDPVTMENALRKVWPDEVYNLAGQVFIPTSWTQPEDTFQVNVCGLASLLKIIQTLKPDTRVYQASSSEMYGNVDGALNETAKMVPVSPYGVSKHAAHELVSVYREHGMFVVAGILFNHESPRRGEHMVTRKVTRQVAKWALGDAGVLELGNLEASRDWGFAGDYVKAMHAMMQLDEPEDFVIGMGEAHTVGEFVQAAVEAAGLDYVACRRWIKHQVPAFSRQNELHHLKADIAKATIMLNWKPTTDFKQLVAMMVNADITKEQKRIAVEVQQ